MDLENPSGDGDGNETSMCKHCCFIFVVLLLLFGFGAGFVVLYLYHLVGHKNGPAAILALLIGAGWLAAGCYMLFVVAVEVITCMWLLWSEGQGR